MCLWAVNGLEIMTNARTRVFIDAKLQNFSVKRANYRDYSALFAPSESA